MSRERLRSARGSIAADVLDDIGTPGVGTATSAYCGGARDSGQRLTPPVVKSVHVNHLGARVHSRASLGRELSRRPRRTRMVA
jgi:hypothetical protein